MTTQDAPKQNGQFRGLLGSKVPFNPAVHSMGPSPMMHDHIAAAMQRPWSQATPTKPKAPFNGAALVDHDVNISPQQSGSGPTSPTKVFMATGSESNQRTEGGGGRPAFTNVPIQAAGPVPGKENSRRGEIKQEEGPWWDILPKLLGGPFCAIDQFGCCNGNHNSEASLTRRKPLCGIGIVFTEANHGALVVQQVVQGSPSHDSGRIEVGDELMTIGGKNVYRQNADSITPMILGDEGSNVTLTFLRRAPGSRPTDTGEQVQVTLTRRYFQASSIPGYITPK